MGSNCRSRRSMDVSMFLRYDTAKQALPAFLKIIEEPMGRKADASWFVMGGYRVAELDAEDRKLLEEFWSRKGRPLTDMLYYREDAVRKVGQEILEIL